MKRLIVALVMAISGIAMAAPPCWACSCAPSTRKERANHADVVFFGRVRSITDDGGAAELRVRFRVRKVYKGRNVDRFEVVRTASQEAACGFNFREGRRYTVFAFREDGRLSTNSCSGTKRGDIDPDNYGLPPGHPPGG
jgi:hypothetical protein